MNQNNNVRQITPEEVAQAEGLQVQLTPEELQKTQILNLNDVQKTIRFEKITSKKPAIIIAVIGIFLLIFGTTFQIATSLNSNNKKVEKRKVEPTPKVVENNLSCVKTTLNNPDGTNTTYTINYYFENNKIIKENREYKYNAIENNPNGENTIKTNLDTYQKLLSSTKEYQVSTNTPNSKELKLLVQIDYKNLDLTTIPQTNQENNYTKVKYNRSTDLNTIKSEILAEGYTCE